MVIKPRIFIGSSSEGLAIAEKLKAEFSKWAECDIWNEAGIFEINKGYLEQLLEHLNLYEYGVMVATSDDEVTARRETKMAPRDNVVFELGLFMGRLGRHRAFYVFEKGTKLPSDLQGITLPQFPKRKGKAQDEIIIECAAKIKTQIDSRSGIFEGGIFPSVPIAFGYFNNFVSVVCEKLRLVKKAKINGTEIDIPDFELHILIPDDLSTEMKKKVAVAKNIGNWEQVSVQAPETRAYDFFADVTFTSSGKAVLKDVPTTLLSLHQTIKEFLALSQIGKNWKEQIVEQREIRRFKAVLDYLIEKDGFTRGRVITEIVDI